ncbi:Alpha/Beta hydrolase protein [Flagelloscypha sp. PMI_526]|nr:Alpha/Beta hydrolase protein [Flagelloscypha sp. PMI_526]
MTSTVTIADPPISFTYTDSGSITESTKYTTVFLLHGLTYHAAICERLQPLAKDHSLRFVCINRRGYAGSTDLSKEEIQVLDDPESDKLEWLRTQGLYLALAISKLIVELELPGGDGNVALCGWSLGTTFALAVLDSLSEGLVPEPDSARIRKHLASALFYDATVNTLGIPVPDGANAYRALLDTSIPEKTRAFAAGIWGLSYFDHDESLPHEFSKLAQKEALKNPPPTNATFVMEDYMRLGSVSVELHVIEAKVKLAPADLAALKEKHLEGNALGITRYLLYGSRSPWTCVYPAWILDSSQSLKVRRMENGNHGMVWDNPDGFLKHVKACIDDE